MSNIHGNKWTNEKIVEEVKEVMKALNLKRMPSRTEIEKVRGDTSLVTAIGRNGGFKIIAGIMKIKNKGHSESSKWNDELIEKEIRNVMKSLNVERMPSKSECESVKSSTALSNKIAKTYGFYGWAEKLGLEAKSSGTQKGLKTEKNVLKLIKENTGLNPDQTSVKSPYDILVNDKVKVEVKYSKGFKNAYYTANLYNGLQKADVLVFICENEELGNKNLIIPSHLIQGLKQLSIGKTSRYDKYIDRWDYINMFDDFMKSIK